MSAVPEDPGHFWRWLSAQPADSSGRAISVRCPDPYCFAPRQLYGDYIASRIGPLRSDDETRGGLSIMPGECVRVRVSPSHVTAEMINGTCMPATLQFSRRGTRYRRRPVATRILGPRPRPGLAKDVPVLILGTGLTMIDYVLSLLLEGHKGPIVAISRRGLLPQVHRRVEPVCVGADEVPFGADFNRLFRWFRCRAVSHVAQGGDWRSVRRRNSAAYATDLASFCRCHRGVVFLSTRGRGGTSIVIAWHRRWNPASPTRSRLVT